MMRDVLYSQTYLARCDLTFAFVTQRAWLLRVPGADFCADPLSLGDFSQHIKEIDHLCQISW